MRKLVMFACVVLLWFLFWPDLPPSEGNIFLVEKRQGDTWVVSDLALKRPFIPVMHMRWIEVPSMTRSVIAIPTAASETTVTLSQVDVMWVMEEFCPLPVPADRYMQEVWDTRVKAVFLDNYGRIGNLILERDGRVNIPALLVATRDTTNKDHLGIRILEAKLSTEGSPKQQKVEV